MHSNSKHALKSLPIHEASTADIRRNSLGFVSLFKPVSAEMSTVGYETDNPMSKSNAVVTTVAIVCDVATFRK